MVPDPGVVTRGGDGPEQLLLACKQLLHAFSEIPKHVSGRVTVVVQCLLVGIEFCGRGVGRRPPEWLSL